MLTPHLDRQAEQCERAKEELAALRESHYHLMHFLGVVKTQADSVAHSVINIIGSDKGKLLPTIIGVAIVFEVFACVVI